MNPDSLPRRLLAELGESHLPVSTPDLIALYATGDSFPRQRVWMALKRLMRRGLVVKTLRGRVAHWSLAGPTHNGER